MTNFVRVGDSEYVINVDRILYIDTDPDGDWTADKQIAIVFGDTDHEGMTIKLFGDNAARFMTMFDRQTGAW